MKSLLRLLQIRDGSVVRQPNLGAGVGSDGRCFFSIVSVIVHVNSPCQMVGR